MKNDPGFRYYYWYGGTCCPEPAPVFAGIPGRGFRIWHHRNPKKTIKTSLPMVNIGHFMIPADNVDRVKHFDSAILGWMIEPTRTPVDAALTAGVFRSILS